MVAPTLDMLPPACVTGIGSLPHTDPHEAVRFVAATCPHLPFWPQLPQRGTHEYMAEQALVPFAGLVQPLRDTPGYRLKKGVYDDLLRRMHHTEPQLDAERAAGFFAFEAGLEAGLFEQAVALKCHIVGPYTLATLFAGIGPDERAALLAALGTYVERLACWQLERLARWQRPIVIFLDEPCFPPLPGDTGVEVVRATIAALRSAGAVVGLHCCAAPSSAVPVAAMVQTAPDILSFDAFAGIEAFCTSREALDFLRSGGIVAFGLIPTWRDLNHVDPQALFSRWYTAVGGVADAHAVARRALITAACGLGLLTRTAARQSFALAHELAATMRGLVCA